MTPGSHSGTVTVMVAHGSTVVGPVLVIHGLQGSWSLEVNAEATDKVSLSRGAAAKLRNQKGPWNFRWQV